MKNQRSENAHFKKGLMLKFPKPCNTVILSCIVCWVVFMSICNCFSDGRSQLLLALLKCTGKLRLDLNFPLLNLIIVDHFK